MSSKRKRKRGGSGSKKVISTRPPCWTQPMPGPNESWLPQDNMPEGLSAVRSIEVKPRVVTIDGYLVLWSERMGHPITSELVRKALRQYLKTLERTRRTKARLRSTPQGRETIRTQNAESRARRREDARAKDETV